MTILTCVEDECAKPIQAKGQCSYHYHKAYRQKAPVKVKQCSHCETDYVASGGGRSKYCSSLCRQKAFKELHSSRVPIPDPDFKICVRCDVKQPRSEFRSDKRRSDGKFPYCASCWRTYVGGQSWAQHKKKLAARKASKAPVDLYAKHRNQHLRQTFNMTPEEYEHLLSEQGYRCQICRMHVDDITHGSKYRRSALAVDHDHQCCPGSRSCGLCVRGLLCSPCNTLIGMARDDSSILIAAAEYVANSLL